MSLEVPSSEMYRKETYTQPLNDEGMPNDPGSPQEPSLFRTILGSCGGIVETAVLILRPSDCFACIDESLRSSPPPRSVRRHSSKAKLRHAQKLKEMPSREGEVVDIPIKLVKSRSGKATENEDGQVYVPYRSFDDSISAISAHTLDEMAKKYPRPFMSTLRTSQNDAARPQNGEELFPPRNGDELLPPPARISSDSSDESVKREQNVPDDEIDDEIPFRRKFDDELKISKVEQSRPSYELIENDIPFIMINAKRRKGDRKTGSRSSSKVTNVPADAHTAPTPKAKSRKTIRRRLSKRTFAGELLETKIAEI